MAGVMFTPSTYGSGAQEDSDWVDLTLLNSWVNFGTGHPPAQYRLLGGVVYIKGVIKSGTVTSGTVLANLPVGCRPLENLIFGLMTSPGTVAVRVDVTSAGNITVMSTGASTAWLSICVPPFIAEQ